MAIEVVIGNQKWNRAAALAIRQAVFVTERKIAREDEFDQKDTDETIYAVAYEDKFHPVATARYEKIKQTVRPGRIATMKVARRKGYGAIVLRAIEDYGMAQGATKSLIHGEIDAIPFYEQLGYKVVSKVFFEDDVPAKVLEKQLS